MTAGCSGAETASPDPSSPGGETATTTPTEASPTLPGGGEDAASDLSSLGCERGADGDWIARGVITSSAPAVASFEVTAVLAGAAADNPDGRRRVLADLEPDVPTEFVVAGIPASGDADAACQLQVVRVEP